jgi:hypothetical protein
MGLTMWGPILDHGVQFSFDNWYHYMETGRIEALRAPYPRLKIFAETLWRSRDAQGLLPVENLGVPWVWIDHDAYAAQRHKQCAYNLHAAAMYTHALAPIARLFGEANQAAAYEQQGETLLNCTIARFWDTDRSIFINNLPWLQDENDLRLCDRSLATAILFDQCPNGQTAPSLEALANCPPEMGLSYPPNAGWRYQALIKLGRTDVVVKDFRTRWITLASVVHNNTLQEGWHARPDSSDQWSHASVAPLYVLFMDIAGIRPAAPGFAKCTIRPQLADLGSLSLTAYTVQGPIHFEAIEESHGHRYRIHLPEGCTGELLLENRTLPLHSGLNTV